jgi:class 3 adenylate cyclase/tetratricopeptide (TPR) repeat protein
MSKCIHCGFGNGPHARYCVECGARVQAVCPQCGSEVAAEQKFCGDCGRSLKGQSGVGAEIAAPPAAYTPAHLAERILASRYAIRGEKRQVTVMFCDIVGSTELAVEVGAEAMHTLISEFFTLALDEVHRYEGTVNQFLGDGFMAIFGAPLAHEDHAARAALAALGILRSVGAAPLTANLKLRLRFGLNSGQVVVGAIGDDLRMDYTASGDTTHLAARLQALASPGAVFLSGATLTSAKGRLQVESLGLVALKGMPHPVEHYRLMAVEERQAARRRGEFVGRAQEMSTLLAIANAVRNSGGVIEIEGEPGVGKSRLVDEMAQALSGTTRVVRAHCVPYGRQAPHVPVLGLLRDLCGIETSDDEQATVAALGAALSEDANDDLDYLCILLGVNSGGHRLDHMDPATVRGRTTLALQRLLKAQAARGPLVALIEDLHWADASSLDYLSALAAVAPNCSALLVVTFRPGSEPPWSARSRLQRLVLESLGTEDARCLALSVSSTAALPDSGLAAILARADGNPFFIEELVRAALQGSASVPGDVADVIGARIDRLSDGAKEVLRIAAVLGRRFSLDVVEEVAGVERRLRPEIEQLAALGFVEPLEGHRQYGFVHALTQEVGYDAMLSGERRRLHSAVAQRLALRASMGERYDEEIARHLLAGEEPRAALPYLDRANERAIREHALEAARDFFNAEMRLLEEVPADQGNLATRVALVLRQFPVFHFTHRHDEYRNLIERYAPQVVTLEDRGLRGAFLAHHGHRLWVAARFAEASKMLEEASLLCREANDPANAAHAEFMLSWTRSYLGDCTVAEAHARTALELLEQYPIPMHRTYSEVALLLSHLFRGQFCAALAAGNRAREAGVAVDDDGLASFGGAFHSFAALLNGDAPGALELAVRAVAEAPTDYFRGWASAFEAAALTRLGRVTEALPILESAAGLARQSGHVAGYIVIAVPLLEARLVAGELDKARALANSLAADARDTPFVSGLVELYRGEIALAVGDAGMAASCFRAGAGQLQAMGAIDALGHAQFGLARALIMGGDPDGARESFERAHAHFTASGNQKAAQQTLKALE